MGSRAPGFTLPSQSERMLSLGSLSGRRPVVHFFYPRDAYGKLDAEVVGISSGSVASHERFAADHELPFDLLSDEGAG